MGLADYAAQHAEDFDRIHAVVEIEGQLLALDLCTGHAGRTQR